MYLYNILFLSLILLRILTSGQPTLQRQLYPMVLLLLFVFSAFRYEVGCDWTGYYFRYQAYGAFPLDALLSDPEPIWALISAAQARLGIAYPWINVFSSFLFFAGAHVLARRQPDPLAFLILLFPVLIINMPMSGIRQGAAAGVMMMAFVAFSNRALVKFIILTLIASGLHTSAMVFLLLAPLVSGHYTRARLLLAALLAIPGAMLLLSGEAADTATVRYIDSGRDAAGAAFRVGLIFLTGLYYVLFLRRKWAATYPQDFRIVSVGALLMLGVFVLVPVSTVIGDRIAYYLIPIQAVMFARVPYLPIQNEKVLKIVLPYVALISMLIVWTSLSGHFDKCYVPYDTWLFGYPDLVRYSP